MNLKCRLLIIFYTTLELLEAYELRFDLQISNISQMMTIMASHFNYHWRDFNYNINNLESGAPYLDSTGCMYNVIGGATLKVIPGIQLEPHNQAPQYLAKSTPL